MKKIDEKRALELIAAGNFPKCKVSSRDKVPVTSPEALDRLKKLSIEAAQDFELYEETPLNLNLPKKAIELSLDDAFIALSKSEVIFAQRQGSENVTKLKSSVQLNQFYRSCKIWGDQFVLYQIVT